MELMAGILTPTMTKVSLAFCCVFAILVLYSMGQDHETSASAREKSLRNAVAEYLKQHGVEADNNTKYVSAFVDLKDDGVQEAIVYLTCQSLCGSGGCPTLVLAPAGSSYKLVSRISLTHAPIRVLEKKSKGWHSLSVWVEGGGIQPGYETELPFDGVTYPSNPTVPPARPLAGNVEGRSLISSSTQQKFNHF